MSKASPAPRESVGYPVERGKTMLHRASYVDQAHAYLFHQIATGVYSEGEQLPSEHELSEMFGVSRPVVRKALEKLRDDDVIESRRGAGSFVKRRRRQPSEVGMTDGRLREILMNLEFRKAIEPSAAYFAAKRRSDADLAIIRSAVDEFEEYAVKGGKVGRHLDFKFHHAVATASGNHRFVEAISVVEYDIDNAVDLVRYLARFDHLERAKKVWQEHLGMYKAIEANDADLARQLMSEHLEQARVRMMEHRP